MHYTKVLIHYSIWIYLETSTQVLRNVIKIQAELHPGSTKIFKALLQALHIRRKRLNLFCALFCFVLFSCVTTILVVFLQPIRGALASTFSRFLDHTQRRATVGRNPLDEWSIRRRDLYLTTHNTHNRQTSMPPVGFEHTVSAGERP